jgi:hypothetical protein
MLAPVAFVVAAVVVVAAAVCHHNHHRETEHVFAVLLMLHFHAREVVRKKLRMVK